MKNLYFTDKALSNYACKELFLKDIDEITGGFDSAKFFKNVAIFTLAGVMLGFGVHFWKNRQIKIHFSNDTSPDLETAFAEIGAEDRENAIWKQRTWTLAALGYVAGCIKYSFSREKDAPGKAEARP